MKSWKRVRVWIRVRVRFGFLARRIAENSMFCIQQRILSVFTNTHSLRHSRSLALSVSLSPSLNVVLSQRQLATERSKRPTNRKGSKLSRDIKSWLPIRPGRIFISTLCATSQCLLLWRCCSVSVSESQSEFESDFDF